MPFGRYILQFIYTLNAEKSCTFTECLMHFTAFFYFLAGILIKLERAVEGTDIGSDDASINLKRSMEYPKKLLDGACWTVDEGLKTGLPRSMWKQLTIVVNVLYLLF